MLGHNALFALVALIAFVLKHGDCSFEQEED